MKERLQKIIASRGICSRRAAEEYIKQGRVKVNGITASLGDSADLSSDIITLDGREVGERIKKVYIMLNKPRGYVTTLKDEAGRPQVSDLVTDAEVRLNPVGRLDMQSEGMLLMTNDGDLVNALTHPSHKVYKQYLVKISFDGPGQPQEPPEKALSRPMTIDGIRLAPAQCRLIEKTDDSYILTIAVREGKNRQIRRMCTNCGYTVNSLKRVAVGDLKLGDLPVGRWRHLTDGEIKYLKSL